MQPLSNTKRALLLSGCAFLLGACAGNGGHDMASLPQPAGANAEGPSSEYLIAARDVLQISVFQVPDLNRTVAVTGNGYISLPLIGNVLVGGKSMEQAQQDIAAKLSKSYLRSPQVSVSLVKSGQRVTLSGAVKSPTVLTIDGRLTLTQAIAQGGGFSELANPERVHVARSGSGSEINDAIVNVNDIQSGKTPDPLLYGGDIVVAEESNTKVALKNIKDVLPFAVLGSMLSDIRLKRDIVLVGYAANRLPLYRYRYLSDDTCYVGVMAQDVAQRFPKMVALGADGYLRVKYSQLGLRLQTWDEWLAKRAA